jgi:PAS domain-containing protein
MSCGELPVANRERVNPGRSLRISLSRGLITAGYLMLYHDTVEHNAGMPIEPTTEELNRRWRESERTIALLREQNRKLGAAFDNMSQGLCMYDTDARHVLCNRRYLEIMSNRHS